MSRQWPNLKLKVVLSPSELEWVNEAASRQGMEPEQFAVKLLEEAIRSMMYQSKLHGPQFLKDAFEWLMLSRAREAGREHAEKINGAVIEAILHGNKPSEVFQKLMAPHLGDVKREVHSAAVEEFQALPKRELAYETKRETVQRILKERMPGKRGQSPVVLDRQSIKRLKRQQRVMAKIERDAKRDT